MDSNSNKRRTSSAIRKSRIRKNRELDLSKKIEAKILSIKYLEKQNRQFLKIIEAAEPREYLTKKVLDSKWKIIADTILQQVNYPLKFNGLINPFCDPLLENPPNLKYYRSRTKVFFEVQYTNGDLLGRIEIMLFDDLVPKPCEKFIQLCKDKSNYVGHYINHISRNHHVEFGQDQPFNCVPIEDLGKFRKLKHRHLGSVGLHTKNQLIGPKISITFQPLLSLPDQIVIGRVVKGLQILEVLQNWGTICGKPTRRLIISKCGFLK